MPHGAPQGFCCSGCRTVYELLHHAGLDRFYELRGKRAEPVSELRPERRDLKWLEPLEAELATGAGAASMHLDIQGVHCSGCVWLIQKLVARQPDGHGVVVNPSVGTVTLTVGPRFPLGDWVRQVERFGYLLGPARRRPSRGPDTLLVRLGVCAALAMNVMMLSAALYLGLDSGAFHDVARWVAFALCGVSVAVGGPVFFRGAWHGLRARVLHLDVPISLGILLALAGSTWSMLAGGGGAVYVDSVAVFIALMLTGRWLQDRVARHNREALLAADGAEHMTARRLVDGRSELVACEALRPGDVLLVAPGELVPVGCKLASADANISTDWINGESSPRRLGRGSAIPAGAFNAGATHLELSVRETFAVSGLADLLRAPIRGEDARHALGRRVWGPYVILVLAAALAGFMGWWTATGSVICSLEVAIAVLVVTCPCAFGIATPLAYELLQAGLRRAGLFVRSASFLDRLVNVRKVAFDKTGTLTTGVLHLEDEAPLARMGSQARHDLYDLCARSSHPRSVALRRALERFGPSLRPDVRVTEIPGQGLEARIEGRRLRLGRNAWALATTDIAPAVGDTETDLTFTIDGASIARFRTEERLRPDAARELDRLRGAGLELWILSGDATRRVADVASTVGILPERALGDLSPQAKQDWIERHDQGDTLFLGDGINDIRAAGAAYTAGTLSIERPFLASRSDFYLVTPGLRPVTLALEAARHLQSVVTANVVFAVAYNVLAVSLAWAGVMKPWLAAVLMPLGSLAVIAATTWRLSVRSPLWRS